jgi:hypothetical protein
MAMVFEAENKRLRALVDKARYRDAFNYANRLYLAHRNHPEAQYLYAVMLGDNKEGLTARESERNRRAAVSLLKPLLKKLKTFDPLTRYRIRNEYYWFSRQPRKQYLLGSAGLQRGVRRALYSQGVGAAWYSLALAQTGQWARAEQWATKSVDAWRNFFKSDRYYNAFVHLGLAHGVLGQISEMENSLRRGAREAGRPASYHEFEEIRDLVRALPSTRKDLIHTLYDRPSN